MTGSLEYVGGPAIANQPLKGGWVKFDGPISTTITVDHRGHFQVALPAGTYRVTGGPHGSRYCALLASVSVDVGQSQEISLKCHIY